MSDGYGYRDERGKLVLEGFSITLRGVGGSFEFIPIGLVYPELGGASNNIVYLRVRLSAGSYSAEDVFDLPLQSLHRLRSDLGLYVAGSDQTVKFPSPELIIPLDDN